MKMLNDYMSMSYSMEIIEDKDERGQIHKPSSLEKVSAYA